MSAPQHPDAQGDGEDRLCPWARVSAVSSHHLRLSIVRTARANFLQGAGTTLLKHSIGELLKAWQRPPSPNV